VRTVIVSTFFTLIVSARYLRASPMVMKNDGFAEILVAKLV